MAACGNGKYSSTRARGGRACDQAGECRCPCPAPLQGTLAGSSGACLGVQRHLVSDAPRAQVGLGEQAQAHAPGVGGIHRKVGGSLRGWQAEGEGCGLWSAAESGWQ